MIATAMAAIAVAATAVSARIVMAQQLQLITRPLTQPIIRRHQQTGREREVARIIAADEKVAVNGDESKQDNSRRQRPPRESERSERAA